MTRHVAAVLLPALVACSAAGTKLAELTVPFEDGDLWGYRNPAGEVVVEPRYFVAGDFLPGGIAPVADESGWSYIDRTGRVVIRPFVFDNGPDPFFEGLARFTEEGLFGFFDESGRVVIEPRFEWVEPFSGGSARYGSGCQCVPDGEHQAVECKRWGRMDRAGRPID